MDPKADDEIVLGEVSRTLGARCDSSRACGGDSWLGGWRSDGAILGGVQRVPIRGGTGRDAGDAQVLLLTVTLRAMAGGSRCSRCPVKLLEAVDRGQDWIRNYEHWHSQPGQPGHGPCFLGWGPGDWLGGGLLYSIT